jgi:hypothetical protein
LGGGLRTYRAPRLLSLQGCCRSKAACSRNGNSPILIEESPEIGKSRPAERMMNPRGGQRRRIFDNIMTPRLYLF